MTRKSLKPAVRPRRVKSNAWWYRLAATSFLFKLLLVGIAFGAVHFMATGNAERVELVSPDSTEQRK